MKPHELNHDRVDLIDELVSERYIWLGERILSGFANTERLDELLLELHDLDAAISHGEVTDNVPAQGYQEAQN